MTISNHFNFLNGSRKGKLATVTLTGDHEWFLPDASGTLFGQGNAASSFSVATAEANAGKPITCGLNGLDPSFIRSFNLANLATDYPLCLPGGRLTLASNNTIVNASNASVLYYLPHEHALIPVWDSSSLLWRYYPIPDAGLTLPNLTLLAAGTYDLFAKIQNGVFSTDHLAWSSNTARVAVTGNLTRKNGIWVNNNNNSLTYLGTVRTTGTTGSTRFNDSESQRFVWNCYNQVEKRLYKTDATATWTYASATVRSMNGVAANRVEVIDGLGNGIMTLNFTIRGVPGMGAGFLGGIGFDSTTVITNGAIVAASVDTTMTRPVSQIIGLGYHFAQALEGCYSAVTVTLYGAGQSALEGSWLC